MIERPHLVHARDSLAKAERFAEDATGAPTDRFELVIHSGYYAMFHAARAALLATEGTASTSHGRVIAAFKRLTRWRPEPEAPGHAAALTAAGKLRLEADYGSKDLTGPAQSVQAQVRPFLAFCRRLVEGST